VFKVKLTRVKNLINLTKKLLKMCDLIVPV
jgi:hypothetical protein